ncbi:UPF0481 protein At3g47200-like [Lycium ferocissimum]|uniref:UPF0481 protein At3g47200-like n=1 Tax=Lycium ferocissimum TaxID=112874 RepID=UPI0028155CD7|nr:UPF0481 protein At3g47200-like [Lycium ferocissimum]
MDKQSAKEIMIAREEGSMDNEIFADEWSTSINSQEISENERQWLSSLGENERQWLRSLEKIGGNPANGSSQKPKIQTVPRLDPEIQSNVSCYAPLVVSIGPIHHWNSQLQPMEKYKKLLALEFADQDSKKERHEWVSPLLSTDAVSIDELYIRVKNIVPDVRECYEDLNKYYSDEEFTQMMFLDGCFILQYFHCIVTGNAKELKMKSHDIAFIRRDLFLLENQLPFEVLQVLMSCKFKNNVGMEMIKTFISSAHEKPHQGHGFIQCIKDFFPDFFLTQKVMNFLGKICQGEGPSPTKQKSVKTPLPYHLLELLKTHLIDPKAFSKDGCYLRGELCSYRSAIELKKAGIHLRRGKSRRFSDILFNSFHFSSVLTLPPITIDDSTKSEFLNLVAYEAFPDTPDDFGVTSYLCFMDSLIDNVEDVKELKSKGILVNFLRTDQEVADLFHEIARDLVPNPYAFVDVKKQIENHYKDKGKIWIRELNYAIAAKFIISLQVASIILAGIQTYYAAHQKES